MAQSLSKIYVHAIFSTKHRLPCLSPDIRNDLYGYIAGVLKNLKCPAIQLGGVSDHLHILCELSKNMKPEELIAEVKVPATKWLKQKGCPLSTFSWQNGYGIFSVSQSQVERVRAYILDQEEHHRQKTFQDEFRKFLTKFQIPYDEQYVWD
jgi:REP element-mobilizing transposase RayT